MDVGFQPEACAGADASPVAPSPGAKAPPSPHGGEGFQQLHHDTAAEHQFSFGWLARKLAPGDPALQDDLVQEMSLAVLQYGKPASFAYLFEIAKGRAKDYLEYEARRGMLPLDEARGSTGQRERAIAGLDELIAQLTERGVPLEWMEEVLGTRLEA